MQSLATKIQSLYQKRPIEGIFCKVGKNVFFFFWWESLVYTCFTFNVFVCMFGLKNTGQAAKHPV